MSLELSLLNNVINNYINKKFILDGPTSQLVSIFTINIVNISYNLIKNININDLDYNVLKSLFDIVINNGKVLIVLYISIIYYIFIKLNLNNYIKLIINKFADILYFVITNNKVYYKFSKYIQKFFIYNPNTDNNKQHKTNLVTYDIDISYLDDLILNVYKFINLCPNLFETNISYKIIEYNDNQYIIYNDLLKFNDTIHNVHGHIKTDYTEHNENNKKHYKFKMILTITKDKDNMNKYISQINNYVKKQMKYGNEIKLKYYKVLPKEMITHVYYDDTIDNWNNDITILKNEFFSEHKALFSIMESKKDYHISKSNTWNNLLFYGAPGLGKSSLIYRIATLLKKSIISIDIAQYLNKKQALYELFLSGKLELPDENIKLTIDNNFIIILEEFDLTIQKLIEIEKLYKYKNLITDSIIKKKDSEINNNINKYKSHINHNPIKNKYTSKMTKFQYDDTNDFNTEDFLNNQLNSEDNNSADNILKNTAKIQQTISKTNNFNTEDFLYDELDREKKEDKNTINTTNDISKIRMDIQQTISRTNEDNKLDILRLGDLLELFQGPVPIKDRMIIATTNHFDLIKNSLPALIRPGRLTPIEFNYMSWGVLNELCMYYFNKTMRESEFKITIPTSHIMELVNKIKSSKQEFDDFECELKKLCENNRKKD